VKRLSLAFAVLMALVVPGVASAHPLGNFTVNHYAQVSPLRDRVEIRYVLDEAEIPTFQEDASLSSDPGGFAQRRAEAILSNLHVTLDGRELPLVVTSQTLALPPGAGGLPTLRLEATYAATLEALTSAAQLQVRDDNDPTRVGWREIVAAPSTGVSDALRQYPEDLLNSPLNVRSLDLTIGPAPAPSDASPVAADASVQRNLSPLSAPGANPLFADLANADELTPAFLVFALGVALVLGAAHALQPGHGKTVVAAYLVGSRGTPRHALFLGLTVTATHTAGVYALGLVTIVLSQYVVPERLYPILEAGSGLLILGIGAWLLGQRMLIALSIRKSEVHQHHHGDHTHSVDDHVHSVGDHRSADGHVHSGTEDHNHHGHSHEVVGWRSLLALGVSGGLLPCPEALMVLLITIAAHRVLFGLLLIVAFSTGLASVLVGFGLLLVYAKRIFNRTNLSTGLIPRLLPVASALVITVAGSLITAQALPQVL
jgi:nickel/cobalt transporter (NicO) family protein